MLVSDVQQSDSVIYTHVYTYIDIYLYSFFLKLFHYSLLVLRSLKPNFQIFPIFRSYSIKKFTLYPTLRLLKLETMHLKTKQLNSTLSLWRQNMKRIISHFLDGWFLNKIKLRMDQLATQHFPARKCNNIAVVFGSGGQTLISEVSMILISTFLSLSNKDSNS